jgi:hypothetical protein
METLRHLLAPDIITPLFVAKGLIVVALIGYVFSDV